MTENSGIGKKQMPLYVIHLFFRLAKRNKKRYKWQMSRIYHEKTRYSDYSSPLPPPQKKKKKKENEKQGGMKKGQGGRRGSRSSNRYYYQTNTKTLNPLSKRF